MKKQIIIALALLVSSFSFSQKSELKDAEKAIKDGNFADAKSAISSAEGMIANADAKTQAKFYYLKGQAFYANGAASSNDLDMAIESFNKVEAVEKSDGKSKYIDEVSEIKGKILADELTKAGAEFESKKFASASDRFEKAYQMSKQDTLYLYYAASTAVSAQDFDKALSYYEQLSDLGYKGVETEYVAIDKETGEEKPFDNKTMRDLSVKSGEYISPKERKTDSKEAEIVKNIALIYVNKGENEKAITAMKKAREANPDDMGLLISEANVHLKMGNKDKFKTLIQEATEKDPNNAELQYNLGVLAADAGDVQSAKKYYQKAIALDPNYSDAQVNMAVLILQREQEIVEQMNSLGSSAADNKKYDALKDERSGIYKEAMPYLEATLKNRPNNIEAAKTLMNIYSALGDTAKFKEMKEKVDALEAEKQ